MIIRTMLLTVYLSITITNADSQFVTLLRPLIQRRPDAKISCYQQLSVIF